MKILKILHKIYPIILSATLIYLLFKNIESFDIIKNIKTIDIKIVFLSYFMFFLIKLSNTYRYSAIYNIREKFKLFFILNYCNFLLNLMPFRIGEVSYIKYFKDYFGINRLTGLNRLLLIRFFDYIMIYLFILFSSFYVGFKFKDDILLYISTFFIISLLLIAISIVLFTFLNQKKIPHKSKYIENFITYLKKLHLELVEIKKSDLFLLFVNSAIYWFLRMILGYSVLYLMGIQISIWLVIFISFVLLMTSLLPIHTFGGFGIFEGGWAYLLVIVGYNYEKILPVLINYHILLLLPVISYGLLAYIVLKLWFKSTT